MRDLEEFQSDVARVFFSLPASHGYVLAGGGALLATGLSDRATEDLDFFGNRTTREISIVSRIFELAAIREGWQTQLIRRNEEFARIQVEGSDSTLIDFCLDVAPTRTTTMTRHGPAFDGEELAGRKLLALFARAKARDFVDVYVLTKKFGRDVILQRAKEVDLGVSSELLCEAFALLPGYCDSDLPIDQALVPDLREFFRMWTVELSAR